MAVNISATLADDLLNLAFKGTTYAGNSTVYAQLHTGAPGSAGTANIATETTREALTLGTAFSAGSAVTTADLTWTSVAATEIYTDITIWTASSGGTFLGSGTITGGSVSSGNNFTIPSGDLTISLPVAS